MAVTGSGGLGLKRKESEEDVRVHVYNKRFFCDDCSEDFRVGQQHGPRRRLRCLLLCGEVRGRVDTRQDFAYSIRVYGDTAPPLATRDENACN